MAQSSNPQAFLIILVRTYTLAATQKIARESSIDPMQIIASGPLSLGGTITGRVGSVMAIVVLPRVGSLLKVAQRGLVSGFRVARGKLLP